MFLSVLQNITLFIVCCANVKKQFSLKNLVNFYPKINSSAYNVCTPKSAILWFCVVFYG